MIILQTIVQKNKNLPLSLTICFLNLILIHVLRNATVNQTGIGTMLKTSEKSSVVEDFLIYKYGYPYIYKLYQIVGILCSKNCKLDGFLFFLFFVFTLFYFLKISSGLFSYFTLNFILDFLGYLVIFTVSFLFFFFVFLFCLFSLTEPPVLPTGGVQDDS